MSRFTNKFINIILGLAVCLYAATPAIADDVEIYLGQNLGVNDVPPNILFVIDTSGSMRENVTSTQGTYDPTVTYAGCFDNNRVYTSDSLSCWTNEYFNLPSFKCQAGINAFNVTGFYVGRMAQWRSSWGGYQWRTIRDDNKNNSVECQEDNGVHGDGGAAVWASNSNGPWSTNSGQSVTWDNLGGSYTLYSGNYKNWAADNSFTKTRLEIVQETVTSVVNSVNNVNIGLMRFDTDAEGGMVVNAVGPIATNKPDFLTALDAMSPNGSTPLAQSLYEAALYYRGGNVEYGNTSSPVRSVAASRTPAVATAPRYDSPIDFQCQKNFIVFLTDGEPSSSDTLDSTQRGNIGAGSCNIKLYDSNDSNTTPDMYHCLPSIASALASNDQSTTFADDQKVSTYTIGFATDQELLEDTAQASKAGSGAGEYYIADDAAGLVTAFTNILTDILGVSSTFSSPAVSVNAFNRTTHRSELYFSLFRPDTGPHWDGNFKRYKLSFNTNNEPVITDVNDQPAINTTTGYFYDNATSFWTTAEFTPDGKEAEEGGAASKLSNNRNVYTYTGTNDVLSNASNLLHESNATITPAMLGVATTAERDNLLRWARGIDVDDGDQDGDNTDARLIMGDPLHGEPAMIQYGGTITNPDITAFVPTNDGYLHAINTQITEGTEIFSFVPPELLQNLNAHYEDNGALTKTYGLDGSIAPWVNDINQDGIISGTDHVYLYFGMRRGGNNYYALDVTDRANPRLMWTIKGGVGDFAELGQTWSRPKLRKLRIGGQTKYVLIFGGGYDVSQDAVSVRTADSEGRAVYIVDAETGQRLWWASSVPGADLLLTDMDYSIPSDISPVDTTGDGYTNIMYVGDMGGQVWRFDIAKSESVTNLSSLITGGRIADLALNASTADTRRFYYPPEVTINEYEGKHNISLILGSGYRAHPLNVDVQDRIYMIRDLPIKYAPTSYTTIDEGDLFDTTSNVIGEGSAAAQAQAKADLSAAHGWYIDLEVSGEKSLAKPVVFAGMAFVTTYIPTDTTSGQSCAPSEGSGRVYIVDVTDGRPTYTNDPTVEKDDLKKDDRYKSLTKAGIPADPKFIKTDDANQKDWTVCIGTECFSVKDVNRIKDLYWFER